MNNIGPFELNKIHQGDCLEVMKKLPDGSIDAIVTDPPWPDCSIDLGWQGPEWWKTIVNEMERVICKKGKIIIHLGSEVNPAPFLLPFTIPFIHICWLEFTPPRYRGNILNHGDVAYQLGYGFLPRGNGQKVLPEICKAPSKGRNAKDFRKTLDWFPCYRNPGHVSWLIRTQVGPGRTVLDPFSGSGTTGCESIKNGCEFIGIESNKEYCEKSNERLEAAILGISYYEHKQGQGTLFNTKR